MRAIDVRHKGVEKVICCFEVDGVLIDPGPGDRRRHAAGRARRSAPARAAADPHPLRPRGRVRRARQALAGPPGLRARARRAAHGRPGEARRERRPPVRRGGGAARAVGRGDPGPGGEPARALGRRDATSRARSGSSTRRATRRTTSPTSTRRRAAAFVGDTGGARIPPHDFTVAPTPPPDIDIAAWERSIETIRAWEPVALAITHFGEAPPEQLDALPGGAVRAARPRGRARPGRASWRR